MVGFLYNSILGRVILKIIYNRKFSKLMGHFFDSRLSKPLIKRFVKRNKIDLTMYCPKKYESFNDCFTRKIKPEFRPIEDGFISPCDGLISAYNITDSTVLPIKQSSFTVDSLLQNKELAEKYYGGICLVFRLCVENYHRYHYIDSGTKEENIHIKGKLHTVRPPALEKHPVFCENSREYTVLHTEHFGDVTQIEVGALLVGKIANHHEKYAFKKGEEKGMFLYGGSTVVLLIEKNKAIINKKYFDATKNGIEFSVLMGQSLE